MDGKCKPADRNVTFYNFCNTEECRVNTTVITWKHYRVVKTLDN